MVLPRIGRVHTHEPTAALLGRVRGGTARVLAATVSFDGRRWQCAFTVEADRALARPAHVRLDREHPVVGVDLGVRDLLVAAAADGTEVARVPAPKPLAAAQARLRLLQRQAARRRGPDRRTGQQPSNRWRRTQTRTGRVHSRAETCEPTCCTRPPPCWPSATRWLLSRTSTWPGCLAASLAPAAAGVA